MKNTPITTFSNTDPIWEYFKQAESLSEHQLQQFKIYAQLLCSWNDRMNLTAITNLDEIIKFHFQDSLILTKVHSLTESVGLIDVGTGAGFPAIPLKIIYPSLPLVLIEVNQKKRSFLAHVIQILGLTDIVISDLDWRTFIRNSDYTADIVCARASLRPDELLRMFKGASHYQSATLVYWAAQDWQPEGHEQRFFEKEYAYQTGQKKRKLIFFKNTMSSSAQ